jgi:hypothetical protein
MSKLIPREMIFQHNEETAKIHLDKCKVKDCEGCKVLRDFLNRLSEENE